MEMQVLRLRDYLDSSFDSHWAVWQRDYLDSSFNCHWAVWSVDFLALVTMQGVRRDWRGVLCVSYLYPPAELWLADKRGNLEVPTLVGQSQLSTPRGNFLRWRLPANHSSAHLVGTSLGGGSQPITAHQISKGSFQNSNMVKFPASHSTPN